MALATEHLLLGLAAAEDDVGRWLRQQGLSPEAVEAEIQHVYGHSLVTEVAPAAIDGAVEGTIAIADQLESNRIAGQAEPDRVGSVVPGSPRRDGERGSAADSRRGRQSSSRRSAGGGRLYPLRVGRSPPYPAAQNYDIGSRLPWRRFASRIAWPPARRRPTWARN